MKMFSHVWQCVSEFFLEREIFKIKFVEKIKTLILHSVTVFRESLRFWDNVEKYVGAREAVDANTAHVGCILHK